MNTNFGKIMLASVLCLFCTDLFSWGAGTSARNGDLDREYWSGLLYKLAEPVLCNMSRGELQRNMSMEYSPIWDGRNKKVAYMEVFGRLMAGIAPWLNLPDDTTPEGQKRAQVRQWALKSYANAVDPDSPDYLLWDGPSQTLVDAAYIAESFLRAPVLWQSLNKMTQECYIKEFKGQRKVVPAYNNWLLFRATIEAFLLSIGEDPDGYVLTTAPQKINEWYLSDGWYSDGSEYSLDYYNSYVIHPMLLDVLETMEAKGIYAPIKSELALRRMQRFNVLLERLISPEGTFPAIGRSATYRMGAFQTLALAAWKYGLPKVMTSGQVRSALTTVMKNMFAVEGNFSKEGFLQLGMVGHQPGIADYYTNNGSLYMTALVFLPLGLPVDAPFWTAPAEDWTQRKAWSGKPFPKDYHESVRK
jgi:hypothetical protein